MKKTTAKKTAPARKPARTAAKKLSATTRELPGIGALLKSSWQLVTARFGALLGLGVLNALLQIALLIVAAAGALLLGLGSVLKAYTEGVSLSELLSPDLLQSVAVVFVLLIVALIVESLLVQMTVLRVLFKPAEGIMDAFRQSVSRFWPVLGASLLVTFITLGGTWLFLLPGLVFSAWFMFGIYEIVLFGSTTTVALNRSAAVIRRHFWGIVGRCAALMLLTMLVGSVFDEVTRSLSTEMQGIAGLASMLYQALVGWIWLAFAGKLYLDVRDEQVPAQNSVQLALGVAAVGWLIAVFLAGSMFASVKDKLPSMESILSNVESELSQELGLPKTSSDPSNIQMPETAEEPPFFDEPIY